MWQTKTGRIKKHILPVLKVSLPHTPPNPAQKGEKEKYGKKRQPALRGTHDPPKDRKKPHKGEKNYYPSYQNSPSTHEENLVSGQPDHGWLSFSNFFTASNTAVMATPPRSNAKIGRRRKTTTTQSNFIVLTIPIKKQNENPP